MKNKATIIALLLGTLASSSAFAEGNVGTINFIGSITDTTCSFIGQQNGTQSNTINLGTHTVAVVNGQNGSPVVDFDLVGRDTNGKLCVIGAAGKSVDISWVPAGGSWAAEGLSNTGSAHNVVINLMNNENTPFSALNETVNYVEANSANGELPFKVNIINTGSNATAGTVVSAAKFAVAYK